ncbi:MAG: SulP family inorganic anion transporter [Burkholderiaceae bacterium]
MPVLPQLARFRPRLLLLRGYSQARLGQDLAAGVTVGVVALPLAMAFAIASGLSPQAGLWTAIIAGFVISALGGSSVQIGGPAGAFIVIVYGIVERYGIANLMISTLCAGLLLFLMGLFKLGNLVRYVPISIVIGFTNGIAVLVALSQVKELLGLQVGKVPADFFSQVQAITLHLGELNWQALALGTLCTLGLWLWPRLFTESSRFRRALLQSRLPGMDRALNSTARLPGAMVALVSLTLLAALLELTVPTIGSRFGSIPSGLPDFELPAFSWATVKQLVTPILTLAILGAIESLLCARVADSAASHMGGPAADVPKHDSNQELMAQGLANMVVPFFGGMPATGTIARTMTNLKSGATSPIAGMVHALVLLAVVLLAAPLALYVPLSVLAGILLFVAWNMGEWREFARLRQFSNHYRMLLLGTFFLTVVFDLTVALEVGLVLSCVLFVRRMGSLFRVEEVRLPNADANPNAAPDAVPDATAASLRFKLHGALFFGAVAKLDALVQRAEQSPLPLHITLDAAHLIALDTSGLDALDHLIRALNQHGGRLTVVGLAEQPRSLMLRAGFASKLEML